MKKNKNWGTQLRNQSSTMPGDSSRARTRSNRWKGLGYCRVWFRLTYRPTETLILVLTLGLDLYRTEPSRRRECLYYLALGYYKLGNYEQARKFNGTFIYLLFSVLSLVGLVPIFPLMPYTSSACRTPDSKRAGQPASPKPRVPYRQGSCTGYVFSSLDPIRNS